MGIILVAVLSWQADVLNRAEREIRTGRPYAAFETILSGVSLGIDGERATNLLNDAVERMEESSGRIEGA